jgi:hypothetical protein
MSWATIILIGIGASLVLYAVACIFASHSDEKREPVRWMGRHLDTRPRHQERQVRSRWRVTIERR